MSGRNPSAASNDAYVSHRFDVPPEIVFAAWTDPAQVARWWARSLPGAGSLDLRKADHVAVLTARLEVMNLADFEARS